MARTIPGDDAINASAIANHMVTASGPDQMSIAAGIDLESHGSASNPSRLKGASDAPALHATHTPVTAKKTTNAERTDTGSSAIRDTPSPACASVPCESQAASAVIRSAEIGRAHV